ncbi:P-loop NTPase fold protein [Amaricoccus solimangrovi]|uniref:KAP NTPase domain-containing protein n=1 Tax=Amaricoccus solimangrovi TaxID=2589815 RepID=A0A501WL12_9RHOB|nr:P-loop NTPase fold protein [Amaricoccus solimangrovi]TPE47897.1 hypothetical protein FJM51_19380 [Amaricoccus solimangrovi]
MATTQSATDGTRGYLDAVSPLLVDELSGLSLAPLTAIILLCAARQTIDHPTPDVVVPDRLVRRQRSTGDDDDSNDNVAARRGPQPSVRVMPLNLVVAAISVAIERDEPEASPQELAALRAWGELDSSSTRKFLAFRLEHFPTPWQGYEGLSSFDLVGVALSPALKDGLLNAAAVRTPVEAVTLIETLLKNNAGGAAETLREYGFGGFVAQHVIGSRRRVYMARKAHEDELRLDVREHARVIARILRSAHGEFTLALFGPWGSGKTTLTDQLGPMIDPDLPGQNGYRRVWPLARWPRYAVVKHNAWKYRASPEAWIFLHSSLVSRASQDKGVLARVALALRASAAKSGYWPIVLALLAICLAALPLGLMLRAAILVGSLVGFAFLLHFASVAISVAPKVRELFARHMRLAGHQEKLGMLALIGDDVRALLVAWTSGRISEPKDSRAPDPDPAAADPSPSLAQPISVVLLAALISAGFLFEGMHPSKDLGGPGFWGSYLAPFFAEVSRFFAEVSQRVGGRLPEAVSASNPSGLGTDRSGPAETNWLANWLIWGCWTISALAILIGPRLMSQGRPDRVLLVIDDIDRCAPDEMLGVIEGTRLLLDDPVISARLQVLMLVDEDKLDHAIAERFKEWIAKRTDAGTAGFPDAPEMARKHPATRFRDELVREQKDKLFACHIRVPGLSRDDIENLAIALAGRENEGLRDLERRAADRREKNAASIALDCEEALAGEGKLPEPLLDEATIRSGRPKFKGLGGDRSPEANGRRHAEAIRRSSQANENLDRARALAERLAPPPEAANVRFDSDRSYLEAETAPVRFTDREVESLGMAAPEYFRELGHTASPRAIRALIFKIQLFRLLLEERDISRPISIDSTLEVFRAVQLSNPDETPGIDRRIASVARQVV